MTNPLPSEELEQIAQTIEMFEVIVQANPRDSQSIEILKDAYSRIGRPDDADHLGRRLAALYVEQGQFASAVVEFEGLLARNPADPELIAALGDVEEKMQQAGQRRPDAGPPAYEMDFRDLADETGTLSVTEQTAQPVGRWGDRVGPNEAAGVDELLKIDGNEAFAKFLIHNRLAPEEVVLAALERMKRRNADREDGTMALSFLAEVVRKGNLNQDQLLCSILEKTKYAYIGLESYEVDRQVVKMLPEDITLGRLVVPFDIMSRTIMVATLNPFDAEAKEATQRSLDYHVQWHIAAPEPLMKALAETYRIAVPDPTAPDPMPKAVAPSAPAQAPQNAAPEYAPEPEPEMEPEEEEFAPPEGFEEVTEELASAAKGFEEMQFQLRHDSNDSGPPPEPEPQAAVNGAPAPDTSHFRIVP